jgi:hypothetical protein
MVPRLGGLPRRQAGRRAGRADGCGRERACALSRRRHCHRRRRSRHHLAPTPRGVGGPRRPAGACGDHRGDDQAGDQDPAAPPRVGGRRGPHPAVRAAAAAAGHDAAGHARAAGVRGDDKGRPAAGAGDDAVKAHVDVQPRLCAARWAAHGERDAPGLRLGRRCGARKGRGRVARQRWRRRAAQRPGARAAGGSAACRAAARAPTPPCRPSRRAPPAARRPPQVEFLKRSGAFDRTHHKRRDEFVDYVEKAIRLGHRLGSRDAPPAGPSSGGKAHK